MFNTQFDAVMFTYNVRSQPRTKQNSAGCTRRELFLRATPSFTHRGYRPANGNNY